MLSPGNSGKYKGGPVSIPFRSYPSHSLGKSAPGGGGACCQEYAPCLSHELNSLSHWRGLKPQGILKVPAATGRHLISICHAHRAFPRGQPHMHPSLTDAFPYLSLLPGKRREDRAAGTSPPASIYMMKHTWSSTSSWDHRPSIPVEPLSRDRPQCQERHRSTWPPHAAMQVNNTTKSKDASLPKRTGL